MRFLAALLFAALAAPTGLAQSAPRPAPEASDSRADLVAALDRAIHNKAHGEYRVTLRGDRIQLQRQNEGACAVLIPVTEATRVEAVGTMILQFQAPGIRLEDCSNGGPREATGVLFLEERDRDAALDAARGLIRGWNEALPDGPTPPVRPAEPDRQPDAQTIRGTLTASDRLLEDGRRFDEHTTQVAGEGQLMVDLRSTDFDPYLYIESPTGEMLSNDDWSGSRSHSRIEIDDPAPGTWTVAVTSYDAGETGAYTVPAPPAPRPSVLDRAAQDMDLTPALNDLISAAPSFERIRGRQLQSSPHPGYDALTTVPNASDVFVECPASGCEVTAVFSTFAADEHQSAGTSYSALATLIGIMGSGTALEGGPYRHEPQDLGFPLADDFVASNGLRLQTRLVDTFATAPGATRYYVILKIVP